MKSTDMNVFGVDVPTWLSAPFYAVLALMQLGAGLAYATNEAVNTVATPIGAKIDVITVLAIASPLVTISLGWIHAYLSHKGKIRRLEWEIEESRDRRLAEARWKGVEARIVMLERGIKCERSDCPIIEVAEGKRPYDDLPFGKIVKDAKPHEDTVDLA